MILASLSAIMGLSEPDPDLDLIRRVVQFLEAQQPAILRRIQLSAELGVVTIHGAVRTFYERQLAVACIRRVAGVRQVIDLLVVMDEARPSAGRRLGMLEVLL